MRYVRRRELPLRAGAELAALRVGCPEEGGRGGAACVLPAAVPRERWTWWPASGGWAQTGASIPGMRSEWGEHPWDMLGVGVGSTG